MRVSSDGTTCIINDALTITEQNGSLVFGSREGTLPTFQFGGFESAETTQADVVEYDDTPYVNGNTGMTLDASAYEATHKVEQELLGRYGFAIGDFDTFYEAAKNLIRKADNGRQAVYILTGGIVSGYRQGLYKGVPFSYIFAGFVNGDINEDSGVYAPTNQGSYALKVGR